MLNMISRLWKGKEAASGRVSLILSIILLVTFITATITISLPDNEIRVTSFDPVGKTELRTNITIKFSKRMVPVDSLDKPVLNPPVRFEPQILGIGRWVDIDVLRFFPDAALLPSTEYTARVQSDKTWASGLKILNKETYKFRTPGLRLETQRCTVEEGFDAVGRVRLVGRLVFNYAVNLKELQDRLKITGTTKDSKSSLNCTVNFTGEDYDEEEGQSPARVQAQPMFGYDFRFASEPFDRTEYSQYYAITMGVGLPCQSCQFPLEDPITLTVSVEPKKPLTILSARSYNEGDQVNLRIDFSHQIDPEAAKSFITIQPPIDFTVEGEWSSLVIHGPFHPGDAYTVTVAKGLAGVNGTPLRENFSNTIQIEDLRPSVGFTSKGVFLPRTGNGLLEFKTVNIDEVGVEVEQIFANNLVFFLISGYSNIYESEDGYWDQRASLLGRSLFIKDKSLESVKNEPLLTTIDLNSIVGANAKGIFKISVRAKEERWTADSRYVILSDIGLTARMSDNYLMVWTNSLADAKPVSNVAVRLISRNNQTLLEGKTDSRGIVTFKDIKEKLIGFDPFVIIAEREGDLSYIRLDESLLPVSDFDVSGRPYLTSGYEAFLYTDRGVYRPGDTIHIVSLVRGIDASVPASFPYFLNINDTRGKKFTSFRMNSEATGLTSLDFVVPDYAATGRYTIAAMIGDELTIGQTSLLVEDFIPDRIKVVAKTDASTYQSGKTIVTYVDGKMLFGPPAAGYQVSGNISIESQTFTPKPFDGYTFANSDQLFTRMNIDLPNAVLDDTGGFRYSYTLPTGMVAPSSLKGLVGVTVSEPGGRGVSAYAEVTIHPYPRYVGVKLTKEGYSEPGKPTEVNVVAVGQDGNPIDLDQCLVKCFRVTYNTIYKKDRSGIYRWISERKTNLLDSSTVAIPAGGKVVSFTTSDYGMYRVVAEDLKGKHQAAVEFWSSGWGYAPWAMDNPDKIELGLDKKEYKPGDNAVLQVRAPFGGTLLVTIEKDQIIETISREMSENTAELNIPVKKEYLPNIYITASVIRPSTSLEPNKPARAFGLVPLRVSNESKKLPMSITAPAVITPKTKATVIVQLPKGKPVDVTIAAVDAGILQLTDFQTPDPLDFFWGKKQPGLKAYDLYAYLYPQVKKSSSHLAAGDMMFAASRKRHLNPFMAKRIKSVALWSGIVKTDNQGVASVTFSVPEFNGKLVVMAVSAQGSQFGSATGEIVVRDKIVVMESFPRFVSPNDSFDGLVTLYNNTGADATITTSLIAEGSVTVLPPSTINVPIEAGKQGKAVFHLKAGQVPGKLNFTITASSSEHRSTATVELANRPALPLVTQYGAGIATRGKPAEFVFPSDWIPGTDQFVIQTSSMPVTQLAKQVQYILAYPYGCLEQTTSKLFPMVYYKDMVKIVNPVLVGGRGADYFIQEGITKLVSMMMPDRSFAYWPGGNYSNTWATVYASHFLSEASRAGYVVDKKVLNDIYENLKDIATGKIVNEVNDEHRVYAAYVLAQAGKLDQKVIGYLKRLDPTTLYPETRYFLAGALALSGNGVEAAKLLPVSAQPNLFEPQTGGTFRSGVKTDAIALDVLLAVAPSSPAVEVLAQSLAQRAQAGSWYTTQDNAFALMALGKYFKGKSSFAYTGEVTVEGDKAYAIDSSSFKLMQAGLGGKKTTITVTSGEGSCFFYWQASGIPISPAAPEFDRGMKVRREYLDEDARPINPSTIKLGDRVICVITAEAVDKPLQNVVINDLLPAGFEIEDPRLKTSARLTWLPAESTPVDYQDIRDDRLLIFTSLYPYQKVKFYYSVRAICAGQFKIPPVAAECMYNPMIASSASSGALSVSQ